MKRVDRRVRLRQGTTEAQLEQNNPAVTEGKGHILPGAGGRHWLLSLQDLEEQGAPNCESWCRCGCTTTGFVIMNIFKLK
jgi:hypothetical protein